jgi:hypothetical protein
MLQVLSETDLNGIAAVDQDLPMLQAARVNVRRQAKVCFGRTALGGAVVREDVSVPCACMQFVVSWM